jgi:DNA-binding CsgD family transcriptional regulator
MKSGPSGFGRETFVKRWRPVVQRRTRPVTQNGQKTDPAAVDRLNDVLGTFTALRDDAQRLLGQISESLRQMRDLRSQLREHRGTSHNGRAKGPLTGAAYLQSRYGLTARETEVAMLLGQGRSNSAIAAALNISNHTARHHTQRVLAKLDVHSRGEAAAKVRR